MTTTAAPPMLVRDVQVRADDVSTASDTREFSGIGVPYNDPVTIRNWDGTTYTEQIAPGAVEHENDVKVFWRHGEIIGRVKSDEDTPAGWKPTSALSDTTLGRDAYALLKDAAIDRMSIGFEPIEHTETEDEDGNVTITRTRIRVREVSLVPFPAYDAAAVEHVRTATPKENPMPGTATADALTTEQVRAIVNESTEDLGRRLDVVADRVEHRDADTTDAPPVTFRSLGALTKAIADGNTDAVDEYRAWKSYLSEHPERAWNPAGTTTGETVALDGWVGDRSIIARQATGARAWFNSAPLPAQGMNVEFGILGTDTIAAGPQAAEGDTLAFGEITFTPDTAPVGTYGGYTRLSKQVVQRSSINHVDKALSALRARTNGALNAAFQTTFTAGITAAAGHAVEAPGATGPLTALAVADWIDVTVEAAAYFEDLGYPMDGLVVDKSVFKSLAQLETTGGEPLLNAYNDTSRAGDLNIPGLGGQLLRVPVFVDLRASAERAVFANRDAVTSYVASLFELTDDDITTLHNDYSVYACAAFAAEAPALLVPVVNAV